MTITIPMQFVGGEPQHPNAFNQHPCIEVWVAANPEAVAFGSQLRRKVWALIDTGADHIYADGVLASDLGMDLQGYIDVNAGPLAPHYKGAIMLEGTNVPLPCKIVTQDFSSRNVPYKLVLGRVVLNAIRLEYQPTLNKCYLHID